MQTKRSFVYQTSSTYNCESELLKSAKLERILEECDIRIIKITNTVWYQLKASNTWLYTASREETLHILCKDDKPRQTQLILTGLIKLSPECDAISDNALLHSQTIKALNTIDKDFIPNVNLNISRLCENLKKHDVNISELYLLNIGKTPHLDLNLLKWASSGLNELYKEAEEIGKHHRTKTLYKEAMDWFYYICYIVTGLVFIYLSAKFSLLSKCFDIFKMCCVPKDGCIQYFNHCFNNTLYSHNTHPQRNTPVVTFTAVPIENNISIEENQSTQDKEPCELNKNEGRRRSRSRSRNKRLSNLM
jgi:hypothetical protein